MNKLISIFSIEPNRNHYDFLNNVLDFCSSDSCVTFFSHEDCKISTSRENVQRINRINQTSVLRFLWSNWKTLKQQERIILEQPFTKLIWYLIFFSILKKPLTLIVHNTNTWISPSLVFNTKHLFFSILRLKISKLCDSYIVVDPNLQEYVQAIVPTKKVYFIPFQKIEKKKESFENTKKSIVIPGMVDSKRRDYHTVLCAFYDFLKANPNSDLQLVLLGRIKITNDTQIIFELVEKIQKIKIQSLKYFTEFIPDAIFHSYLTEATFVLSNVTPYYNHSQSPEIYGITKATGISFAMINYELPCISSVGITPIDYTYNQILYYRGVSELKGIFSSISNNKIDLDEMGKICSANRIKMAERSSAHKIEFQNFINS
jgi:hypothetical protein